MGWETIATTGFQAFQTSNTMGNASAQSKAIAQEGTYKVQQIADQTVRKAGSLQNSFLSSGLTTDMGVSQVVQGAYTQGQTDIARTAANYNTQSKNVMTQARTQALNSWAKMGASALGGKGGSVLSDTLYDGFTSAASNLPDSFAYALNDAGFGNTAYDILAKSNGE